MNLTLEESNTEEVPPLLEDLAQKVVKQGKCSDSTQKDLFNVLIIILMIENGLLPVNSNMEVIYDLSMIDDEQLWRWRTAAGLLEANFVLQGFETVPVKLIISPLGAMALLNVVITDLDSETYTVCLPFSRYVVSPQASTVPMMFRDLKHLALTFKNKILAPVKSRILWQCGYPGASLVGLPEEVLYKIHAYLPASSVVRVAQTCRRMKVVLENEGLWRELFKRDFGNNDTDDRTDWKTLYKEKYTQQLEAATARNARAAGAMHDYMDYADYVSYIDNPLWNSMII